MKKLIAIIFMISVTYASENYKYDLSTIATKTQKMYSNNALLDCKKNLFFSDINNLCDLSQCGSLQCNSPQCDQSRCDFPQCDSLQNYLSQNGFQQGNSSQCDLFQCETQYELQFSFFPCKFSQCDLPQNGFQQSNLQQRTSEDFITPPIHTKYRDYSPNKINRNDVRVLNWDCKLNLLPKFNNTLVDDTEINSCDFLGRKRNISSKDFTKNSIKNTSINNTAKISTKKKKMLNHITEASKNIDKIANKKMQRDNVSEITFSDFQNISTSNFTEAKRDIEVSISKCKLMEKILNYFHK